VSAVVFGGASLRGRVEMLPGRPTRNLSIAADDVEPLLDLCRLRPERLTPGQKVMSSSERDRPVTKRLFRQRAGGVSDLFALGVHWVSDSRTCSRACAYKKVAICRYFRSG
jgi:hypothetical protein